MSSLQLKISSATAEDLLAVTIRRTDFEVKLFLLNVFFFSQGHGSLMKHVRPYSRDATHEFFRVEPSTWPHSVGEMTVDDLPWALEGTDRLEKRTRSCVNPKFGSSWRELGSQVRQWAEGHAVKEKSGESEYAENATM